MNSGFGIYYAEAIQFVYDSPGPLTSYLLRGNVPEASSSPILKKTVFIRLPSVLRTA